MRRAISSTRSTAVTGQVGPTARAARVRGTGRTGRFSMVVLSGAVRLAPLSPRSGY